MDNLRVQHFERLAEIQAEAKITLAPLVGMTVLDAQELLCGSIVEKTWDEGFIVSGFRIEEIRVYRVNGDAQAVFCDANPRRVDVAVEGDGECLGAYKITEIVRIT